MPFFVTSFTLTCEFDSYLQTRALEKEFFNTLLERQGIVISMSRKGNPYDNAKLESFMKTLKTEEVYLNEYETERDARTNIGKFIETLYNIKRLHSSLGYCSPDKFEALFYSREAA